jgi:hypothetical protein
LLQGTEYVRRLDTKIAAESQDLAKFPVFFPVSREFGAGWAIGLLLQNESLNVIVTELLRSCSNAFREIVDHRLVLIGDVGDPSRQGEHRVEVWHRQQLRLALGQPFPRRRALARGGHWTQDKYLVDTEAMNKSAPSVALSAGGGNTMVRESNDSGRVGAALVSTISGGGSTHQDRVLSSYFEYHHEARTHLSLDKDCPRPRPVQLPTAGHNIIAFPEVGGLHHRYERRAA